MKYGNRCLWKRLFYSPIGILIGFLALILILHGAWSVHQKALLSQERLNQAEAELQGLRQQQVSLSASISDLSSTEGIEAALREKYHAVKQGESVAVIIDNSSGNDGMTTSSVLESSSTEKISLLGKVLQFIGF